MLSPWPTSSFKCCFSLVLTCYVHNANSMTNHCAVCLQDVEVELRISNCVKSENGKFYIEEPLDSLLHCVSWILLLQEHGKTDRSLDSSWACYGFSLSQENEVFCFLMTETDMRISSFWIKEGKIECRWCTSCRQEDAHLVNHSLMLYWRSERF